MHKSPLLVIWTLFLISCFTSVSALVKQPKSVYDILVKDERFSKFVKYIEETEVVSYFKNMQSGTVFAPIDKAFDALDTDYYWTRYTADDILYHVLPLSVKSKEFWDGRVIKTAATVQKRNQYVKMFKGSDGYSVGNHSHIVDADLEAANGIIHAVDKVLALPFELDTTLNDLSDAKDYRRKISLAGLDSELQKADGYTLFVTKGDFFGNRWRHVERKYLENKAGKKDLGRLLHYQMCPQMHLSEDLAEGKYKIPTVGGEGDLDVFVDKDHSVITVNGVKVIEKDILASNGVIYLLDGPLVPQNKDTFIKMDARKALAGMNATDFVDLFDNNDLGDYLNTDGTEKWTILAPPNESLDNDTPNNDIKSWLKYHIVRGKYTPDDLEDGQMLKTESHDRLGSNYQQILDVHITDQDPNIFKDHSDRVNTMKQSIQFGRSAVLDDPVEIGQNLIIYPITRALYLPRDPLNRLPVKLELSTFVAGLYASESDSAIKKAEGVSIFAPTNDAFRRLGLVAKYLLQPDSKDKLEKVIQYQVVRELYYSHTIKKGEHRENTLSGYDIILNKTDDGLYLRGSGAANGEDRSVIGKVIDSDILVSNGVIHTVDRVQLPYDLEITNHDLLSAEGTHSLLNLLKRAGLEDQVLNHIDKTRPYTILAPSDRAFAKLNLTRLLQNPEKLLKVAKLHVLPVALPSIDSGEIYRNSNGYINMREDKDEGNDFIGYTGEEFSTLLDDDTRIVISRNVAGGYSVKVKGSSQDDADVTDIGRGSGDGGVIEIDRVLLPSDEVVHNGLSWWAIALIVLGSLLGAALVGAVAYYGWRYYQDRQNRIHLPE
ncbi:FAS1 domain-containing protein [Pilobolus umbonatus]|nr:FAS1 domain-containing protein [Pilobolus umbonatus]